MRRKSEVCSASIDILQAACIRWFRKNGIEGQLFFPDCETQAPRGNGALHVVFFGSFIRRSLQSYRWPKRPCRFWVLSHSVRDVFVHLLQVPAQNISVIPRYELMPLQKEVRRLPKPSEAFTLVFGGRISATKNIELLLYTVFYLQTVYKIPVSLVLSGDFDPHPHLDRRRSTEEEERDYEKDLKALIARLPWEKAPLLYPKSAPDRWFKRNFKNPVCINLSTFVCEDFDVSLAQTQAAGWPAIVSDWGGHREVNGPNILKISAPLIGHSHEPSALIALRGKQLAALLKKQLTSKAQRKSKVLETQWKLPEPLAVPAIKSMRTRLKKALGPQLPKLIEGDDFTYNFVPSGESTRFFSHYRAIFSGPPSKGLSWIIISDLLDPQHPVKGHVLVACSLLLKKTSYLHPKAFQWAKESFHSDFLLQAGAAKSVTLSHFDDSMLPLVTALTHVLPQKVPLKVLVSGKASTRLRQRLRPGDKIFAFVGNSALAQQVRRIHD